MVVLDRRFSPGGLQEFLKQALPDYLGRGTDLFFLRWSNKKKQNHNSQHNSSRPAEMD